jgi:hypothetical protein
MVERECTGTEYEGKLEVVPGMYMGTVPNGGGLKVEFPARVAAPAVELDPLAVVDESCGLPEAPDCNWRLVSIISLSNPFEWNDNKLLLSITNLTCNKRYR